MNKLNIFIERMKKVGVDLELAGNFPWVYITKINGKPVKEKFQSDHGFVLGFSSDTNFRFSYGTTETFKLIRKYV